MINDNAPVGATPLDPDEQEGCKHKHITTREQLDELEQVNIQQGLQWLQKYRQKDVLTDAFMRKLHIRLFGEVWGWAGTYRKTEKNIGIDPREISVQLRVLLDNAKYWAANAPKTVKAKVRSFAVSNAISFVKSSPIFAGQKH